LLAGFFIFCTLLINFQTRALLLRSGASRFKSSLGYIQKYKALQVSHLQGFFCIGETLVKQIVTTSHGVINSGTAVAV